MNKIKTISLAASLIIAFAALIVFSKYRSAQNASSVGSLEVWGTQNESVFSEAFAQYLGSKKITINYKQKSESSFGDDFTEALARGSGPDLVIADANWITAHSDTLASLAPESFKPQDFRNTFVDVAGSAFIINENIKAFPLWVDPIVLYWNRDLLNAFSIEKPPANWVGVISASNAIKETGQSGAVKRAGVALGRARNIPLFKEIISMLLMQQRSAIEDPEGRFIFGPSPDRQNESVLRFYTDFGNLSNNTVYTWNTSLPNPRSLFLEGKLALMLDYASYIVSLRSQNPHISVSLAEAPQLKGAEIPVHFANVEGVAVSHMSKKINPSWSFAFWLAGANPASSLLKGHVVAPARRDLAKNEIYMQNPFHTVLQKAALTSKRLKERFPEKNSGTIFEMIESVADGRRTVSEAVIYAVKKRMEQ